MCVCVCFFLYNKESKCCDAVGLGYFNCVGLSLLPLSVCVLDNVCVVFLQNFNSAKKNFILLMNGTGKGCVCEVYVL